MDRVTVFTAFNPVQAQIVSTRLQTAGLDATVEGEAAALSMEGTRLPPEGFACKFRPLRKTRTSVDRVG